MLNIEEKKRQKQIIKIYKLTEKNYKNENEKKII
jgi:hypothetical protein